MKKIIYYFFMMTWFILTPSCDDDNEAPAASKLLLSKIERNGITLLEFSYDTERKLRRMNHYSSGVLNTYTLYEYNDKGMEESRRYSGDDDMLEYKTVFTLDNLGRIIKNENYTPNSDFEKVVSTLTFKYDPSGTLTNQQYSTSGEPISSKIEYTYNASAQLTKIKGTLHPNQPTERVSLEIDYIPADKSIPVHWDELTPLLSPTGLSELIWEIFNISSHSKVWDIDEELSGETRKDATQQQYNSDGYLIRQVLTRVDLLNNSPDAMNEMTYEYTQ